MKIAANFHRSPVELHALCETYGSAHAGIWTVPTHAGATSSTGVNFCSRVRLAGLAERWLRMGP